MKTYLVSYEPRVDCDAVGLGEDYTLHLKNVALWGLLTIKFTAKKSLFEHDNKEKTLAKWDDMISEKKELHI